jgi:hypothetical protein
MWRKREDTYIEGHSCIYSPACPCKVHVIIQSACHSNSLTDVIKIWIYTAQLGKFEDLKIRFKSLIPFMHFTPWLGIQIKRTCIVGVLLYP